MSARSAQASQESSTVAVRCEAAYYCGKDCQVADWKTRKLGGKKAATIAESSRSREEVLQPAIDASKLCGNCQKAGAKLACAKCMVAVYCDRECQKKGWKTHRNNCFEDTALARKQMKESLKNEGATLESRFMAAVCFGQLAAARQYYSLGADIKGTGKSLAAVSSAVAGRHLEILKFVVEEVVIHVHSIGCTAFYSIDTETAQAAALPSLH